MFTFLFKLGVRATFISLVSILAVAAYAATAWQFPTLFRGLKKGAEYVMEVIAYVTRIDPKYLNIASELGLDTKLVMILYVIVIYLVLSSIWRICTNTTTRAKNFVQRPKNKKNK